MRVLWFTNTPSLATELLSLENYGGGWILSLQKLVEKVEDLDLGIAFHHGTLGIKEINLNGTSYYAIPQPADENKLIRLIKRWKHIVEPETQIHNYLNIIDSFKPDLIHVFGSEQAFGLICEKTTIPVVLQIQGNLTVYSKKWFSGLSRFQVLRYSNIKLLLKAYGIWHDYFPFTKRALREQRIFANCRFFIGRTDWDKRITKTLSNSATYFHCDEPLREEFFKPEWISNSDKLPVLFSTIKPSTFKGLETILETAYILTIKKGLNFEWNIAGIDKNEEIIRIIEKICKTSFKENHIFFLGSIGPQKLSEQLLASACFVHPSHIENSPNSVCEAMLLGMPIVATNSGGTPSLLDNNKEGLLVQDGDPYAMAGAILEIVENPDFAENLGKSARKRAQERHNPEKILEDLLAIYHQVLSESSIKK
ncbi:MAG TPA: glycosyltransferase family 4 protein [Bacteroidales bacterium]|nr:glycosyltransferase family 4 protein [Bacteroidales bacterium]